MQVFTAATEVEAGRRDEKGPRSSAHGALEHGLGPRSHMAAPTASAPTGGCPRAAAPRHSSQGFGLRRLAAARSLI